jgi:quercetin dioxygenase-like cupin family protein
VKIPHLPAFSYDELPRDRAIREGAARLAGAVAELPLRYGPFFARLAELWQVPEARVISELSRAKDAKSWRFTLLRGMKMFDVDLGRPAERQRSHLMHFAPGVRLPQHTHRGTERVLVLEGSYADADGHEVRAGDEQTMADGSEHELYILGSAPCVAAVTEHGISFAGPLLRRWAGKLSRGDAKPQPR